jgi:hypothetical protein
MTRYHFLFALIIAYTSCNKPSQEVKVKPRVEHFSIPTTINSQPYDSLQLAEAKWVTYNDPHFIGKYSFQQRTIDINPFNKSYGYYDSLDAEQKHARISPYLDSNDSIDYNGFDIVVDYDKDIYYTSRNTDFGKDTILDTYYAVYVVNATNNTKVFNGIDGSAYGIQEAKERWNKNVGYSSFRPIEHKNMRFCGMGNWSLYVKPREFIVLLFPKYKGEFKTEMRVRLEIGESIYVSKRFTGTVSEEQFKMHDFTIENIQTSESSTDYIRDKFYGATPDAHQWTKKKVTYRPK